VVAANSKVRILIADDYEIVRKGLRAVFDLEEDLEIVGEAIDGYDVLDKVGTLEPDVLLVDLRMRELKGIELCREIRSLSPKTRILVLTSYQNDTEIFRSLKAGVSGYLLKDINADELVRAVKVVSKGESFLHPVITQKVMEKMTQDENSHINANSFNLTSREKEVLSLMATGCKNIEIAQRLWISEKTVKTHVSSILRKLNQADRTKAVIFAIGEGLVEAVR